MTVLPRPEVIPEPPPIIGESLAIRKAVATLRRYAGASLAILLIGATGTGKELFARYAHYWSRRRGELVDVDCGALPRDMVEGLLFGYRRGAFTGATEDRAGLIEAADGGTLFLDELTSLAEESQRKLLRVLDTAEVRRLGDTRKRSVDLRTVSAVQDDVPDRLVDGTLRRDLYERVAGVVIHLPALVDRPEDFVPLARYFAGVQGQALELAAERRLEGHDWPGNVRELRKVIERAGPLGNNGAISARAIAEAIALGAPTVCRSNIEYGRAVHEAERIRLRAACEANGWHAERTARALGIHRATLFRKLTALGLSLRGLRASH